MWSTDAEPLYTRRQSNSPSDVAKTGLTAKAPMYDVTELTKLSVSFFVWFVMPARLSSSGRKYVISPFPES